MSSLQDLKYSDDEETESESDTDRVYHSDLDLETEPSDDDTIPSFGESTPPSDEQKEPEKKRHYADKDWDNPEDKYKPIPIKQRPGYLTTVLEERRHIIEIRLTTIDEELSSIIPEISSKKENVAIFRSRKAKPSYIEEEEADITELEKKKEELAYERAELEQEHTELQAMIDGRHKRNRTEKLRELRGGEEWEGEPHTSLIRYVPGYTDILHINQKDKKYYNDDALQRRMQIVKDSTDQEDQREYKSLGVELKKRSKVPKGPKVKKERKFRVDLNDSEGEEAEEKEAAEEDKKVESDDEFVVEDEQKEGPEEEDVDYEDPDDPKVLAIANDPSWEDVSYTEGSQWDRNVMLARLIRIDRKLKKLVIAETLIKENDVITMSLHDGENPYHPPSEDPKVLEIAENMNDIYLQEEDEQWDEMKKEARIVNIDKQLKPLDQDLGVELDLESITELHNALVSEEELIHQVLEQRRLSDKAIIDQQASQLVNDLVPLMTRKEYLDGSDWSIHKMEARLKVIAEQDMKLEKESKKINQAINKVDRKEKRNKEGEKRDETSYLQLVKRSNQIKGERKKLREETLRLTTAIANEPDSIPRELEIIKEVVEEQENNEKVDDLINNMETHTEAEFDQIGEKVKRKGGGLVFSEFAEKYIGDQDTSEHDQLDMILKGTKRDDYNRLKKEGKDEEANKLFSRAQIRYMDQYPKNQALKMHMKQEDMRVKEEQKMNMPIIQSIGSRTLSIPRLEVPVSQSLVSIKEVPRKIPKIQPSGIVIKKMNPVVPLGPTSLFVSSKPNPLPDIIKKEPIPISNPFQSVKRKEREPEYLTVDDDDEMNDLQSVLYGTKRSKMGASGNLRDPISPKLIASIRKRCIVSEYVPSVYTDQINPNAVMKILGHQIYVLTQPFRFSQLTNLIQSTLPENLGIVSLDGNFYDPSLKYSPNHNFFLLHHLDHIALYEQHPKEKMTILAYYSYGRCMRMTGPARYTLTYTSLIPTQYVECIPQGKEYTISPDGYISSTGSEDDRDQDLREIRKDELKINQDIKYMYYGGWEHRLYAGLYEGKTSAEVDDLIFRYILPLPFNFLLDEDYEHGMNTYQQDLDEAINGILEIDIEEETNECGCNH